MGDCQEMEGWVPGNAIISPTLTNKRRNRESRKEWANTMHDEDEDLRLPPGCKLFMIANFFKKFPEPSGGTRHFLELARTWKHAGQPLTVVTPLIGKLNCEAEGYHGVFSIVPPAWARRLGNMPSFVIWGLATMALIPWRREPTVLYSTSPLLPDIFAAYFSRLIRRKPVFWIVCLWHLVIKPAERGGGRFTAAVLYAAQLPGNALIKHKCDMIIVDTKMMKKELVKRGFREERIFVTSFGAREPDLTQKIPTWYEACFLGKIHNSKGIFDLVRIWGRVCEKRPGSRLAMVGTGEELEALRRGVEAAGLKEQIQILGYLPRTELERVLASSKVFVFPSHEEGFGISLIEAMSFGLPVVAYALSHYPEVFGEALMTGPVGDERKFSQLVLDLLEDEALRVRKSEESRKLASRFNWHETTRREAEEIVKRVRRSGISRASCP